MKTLITPLVLLCSLHAWAQTDTLPPDPVDLEKLVSNNGTFTRVDDRPQFPGGEVALVEHLRDNLRYPDDMRQAHVEGVVRVAFTVAENGELENVRVQQGIPNGAALDREAVRVVEAMPRWRPAHVNDVPVPMDYLLPVTFKVAEQP